MSKENDNNRTRTKEAHLEQCVSEVIVVSIHVEIVQKVVGVRLRYIDSVKIQTEEHHPGPDHDSEINFTNDGLC